MGQRGSKYGRKALKKKKKRKTKHTQLKYYGRFNNGA
jgi:hypothetical protein